MNPLDKISQEEWSVLKNLVQNDIDKYDKELKNHHDVMLCDPIIEDSEDKIRWYGETRQLRDFLIVLREKIDWYRLEKEGEKQ